MAFMNAIGNWLVRSRWVEIFERLEIEWRAFSTAMKLRVVVMVGQVSPAAFLAGDTFRFRN